MGRSITFGVLIVSILAVWQSYAGIWDQVTKSVETVRQAAGPAEESGLSDNEIASGLKDALRLGAERAVDKASAAGGFLNDPAIRIPLPGKLKSVGDTMRKLGLGGPVDNFELTMNTAAEKASAEALPVIGQAVTDLTLEDARRVWQGGDTAATEYFRQKTWQPLYDKFRPIVDDTARQAGVTQAYKSMIDQSGMQTLIAGTDFDVDHYVTEKSLEGLFALLAQEEKRIRTDPVARTTDILKKVFGQ